MSNLKDQKTVPRKCRKTPDVTKFTVTHIGSPDPELVSRGLMLFLKDEILERLGVAVKMRSGCVQLELDLE